MFFFFFFFFFLSGSGEFYSYSLVLVNVFVIDTFYGLPSTPTTWPFCYGCLYITFLTHYYTIYTRIPCCLLFVDIRHYVLPSPYYMPAVHTFVHLCHTRLHLHGSFGCYTTLHRTYAACFCFWHTFYALFTTATHTTAFTLNAKRR